MMNTLIGIAVIIAVTVYLVSCAVGDFKSGHYTLGPSLPMRRKKVERDGFAKNPLSCPVCFNRTKRGHFEQIQGFVREENFYCVHGHYDYQYLEGKERERIGNVDIFCFDNDREKKRSRAMVKARKENRK